MTLPRSCRDCWYKSSLFSDMACIVGQDPKTCAMPKHKRNFRKPPCTDVDFLFASPEDKERSLQRYSKLLNEIYDVDN